MYPLIRLTDSVVIPTYFLIISLTYCLGLFWLVGRAQKFKLDRLIALDLALAFMIGGLIGARLTHVFWEQPQYYFSHPLDAFKIWLGGFVFYGGAFGAFLGAILVSFIKGFKLRDGWLDLFAPLIPAGYALGRVGCLLAGCCFGRACDLPWAIHFPEGVDAPPHIGLHPTQIYATLWETGVLLTLLILENRKIKNLNDSSVLPLDFQNFAVWLVLHGIGRIVMEFFRADERGGLVLGQSFSTLISVILVVTGGLLLGIKRSHNPVS